MISLRNAYQAAFLVTAIAASLVIAAILSPTWASYSITTAAGERLHLSVGLHRSCSNIRPEPCRPFPDPASCAAEHDSPDADADNFCTLWRSLGFSAYLAAIVILVMVACAGIAAVGPPKSREVGWKLLVPGLVLAAAVQLWGVSIVQYLMVHGSVFRVPGWKLDKAAWWFIVAMLLVALDAIGLGVATVVLEGQEEGVITLDDPMLAEEANGRRRGAERD